MGLVLLLAAGCSGFEAVAGARFVVIGRAFACARAALKDAGAPRLGEVGRGGGGVALTLRPVVHVGALGRRGGGCDLPGGGREPPLRRALGSDVTREDLLLTQPHSERLALGVVTMFSCTQWQWRLVGCDLESQMVRGERIEGEGEGEVDAAGSGEARAGVCTGFG